MNSAKRPSRFMATGGKSCGGLAAMGDATELGDDPRLRGITDGDSSLWLGDVAPVMPVSSSSSPPSVISFASPSSG